MSAGRIVGTGLGRPVGLHLASTLLARYTAVIGTYRTERDSLDELRRAGEEFQRGHQGHAGPPEVLVLRQART